MSLFPSYTLRLRRGLIEINRPQVMGIVNITPDSFYDGSRTPTIECLRERVEMMLREGADMIDVGGYSSRPGAAEVSAEEETDRIAMGMEAVRSLSADIPVSVDTFRASVARFAVEQMGADIVNDISGGALDDEMFSTVARLGVPYILMHMRGCPQSMQQYAEYSQVAVDVTAELAARISEARRSGIADVIADPGFGFSKTSEQCFELLAHLSEMRRVLDVPMLVGLSRKSMLYRSLDSTPAEALNATTVVNTIALLQGASILRVHDVRPAVEAVTLVCKTTQYNKNGNNPA